MSPTALITLVLALPPLAARQGPLAHAPPTVTAFRVQAGAASALPGTALTLDHVVTGRAPSAFRVSTTPDFRDAAWLPYERTPRWTPAPGSYGSAAGCGARAARVVVYFQVRAEAAGIPAERLRGHDDGAGHVLSNVSSGAICLLLAERAPPS